MMVSSSLIFSSTLIILMYHRYVIRTFRVLAIFLYLLPYFQFLHWSENCKTCLCQKFHYHSWGLKLNPALKKKGSGSVSLCLYKPFTVNHSWGLKLNPAFNNSYWLPGVSTMLQLLVSLQGLILNTTPFNWHQPIPSDNTETQTRLYDEDVFVLSLRTMTYTMRSPPKVRLH